LLSVRAGDHARDPASQRSDDQPTDDVHDTAPSDLSTSSWSIRQP
jgi:hypothetical protein